MACVQGLGLLFIVPNYATQVEIGEGTSNVSSVSLLLWKKLPRNLIAESSYILLVINLVINLVTT